MGFVSAVSQPESRSNTADMTFRYATHIHPFMPIFDMTNLFSFYESTRAKSSFLFSVILAISARFTYRKPTAQPSAAPPLEIDAQTFDELADTAESHLARTLLRKQHALTDVQATLLMGNWGLRSGGGGPDGWVSSVAIRSCVG
jgi:hypothetical protein